jgi:hypothetical protein
MGGAMAVLNPVAALQGAMGDPVQGALSGITNPFGTEGLDGARSDMDRAQSEANRYLKEAYDSQMGFAKPYQEAGLSALAQLQNYDPTKEAGYQFGLNQGLSGIDRSMAARGMGNSGAALKALTRFGNDYASTKYNDGYNRLMGMAGLGQNAYQNMGNWAGAYGQGVANNKMAQGQANMGYQVARGNQGKELLGQGLKFGASLLGGLL